jgi:hypothetical protein
VPANQSGNLIHFLANRTGFLKRPSAEVADDPTAKFVNRQMGYGGERFFEGLYFRWIRFASTVPGYKNVQRSQDECFGTHGFRPIPNVYV